MNVTALAVNLAGGLGLFLLGMSLMTDGLRLAAGSALTRMLAAATRTRWHALGAGMLVTALVQSSSAVTVAAIGFVNAGLLGLGPALWVLFGANVGTTMTGWIVALVGLKLDIAGAGAAADRRRRRAAPERRAAAPRRDRQCAGRLRPALPGHRDAADGLRRPHRAGHRCRRAMASRPCWRSSASAC